MNESKKLLEDLVSGTGLPRDLVEKEVDRLLEKYNLHDRPITLDDIRLIMVDYLQDVLPKAKQHYSA